MKTKWVVEEDPYRDYPHVPWTVDINKRYRRNGVAPIPWTQLILVASVILFLYWVS